MLGGTEALVRLTLLANSGLLAVIVYDVFSVT